MFFQSISGLCDPEPIGFELLAQLEFTINLWFRFEILRLIFLLRACVKSPTTRASRFLFLTWNVLVHLLSWLSLWQLTGSTCYVLHFLRMSITLLLLALSCFSASGLFHLLWGLMKVFAASFSLLHGLSFSLNEETVQFGDFVVLISRVLLLVFKLRLELSYLLLVGRRGNSSTF